MTVSDALLLGSVIAGILSALFAHRIRTPSKDGAPVPAQFAITGGAMADTFAIQQNTDAINRLAAANEKLAGSHVDIAAQAHKAIAIMDKALDEVRDMRRALQNLKP